MKSTKKIIASLLLTTSFTSSSLFGAIQNSNFNISPLPDSNSITQTEITQSEKTRKKKKKYVLRTIGSLLSFGLVLNNGFYDAARLGQQVGILNNSFDSTVLDMNAANAEPISALAVMKLAYSEYSSRRDLAHREKEFRKLASLIHAAVNQINRNTNAVAGDQIFRDLRIDFEHSPEIWDNFLKQYSFVIREYKNNPRERNRLILEYATQTQNDLGKIIVKAMDIAEGHDSHLLKVEHRKNALLMANILLGQHRVLDGMLGNSNSRYLKRVHEQNFWFIRIDHGKLLFNNPNNRWELLAPGLLGTEWAKRNILFRFEYPIGVYYQYKGKKAKIGRNNNGIKSLMQQAVSDFTQTQEYRTFYELYLLSENQVYGRPHKVQRCRNGHYFQKYICDLMGH